MRLSVTFFLSPIGRPVGHYPSYRDDSSAAAEASEVTESNVLNTQNLLLLHDLNTHVSTRRSTLTHDYCFG